MWGFREKNGAWPKEDKEGNLKEMSKKDIFFAMVRRTENTKKY